MLSFFEELKQRNASLYFFGCCCFVAAVLCAIMLFVNSKQVLGINSFIKPLKFFLSSGIYVWTMGWLMYHLGEEKKIMICGVALLIKIALLLIHL